MIWSYRTFNDKNNTTILFQNNILVLLIYDGTAYLQVHILVYSLHTNLLHRMFCIRHFSQYIISFFSVVFYVWDIFNFKNYRNHLYSCHTKIKDNQVCFSQTAWLAFATIRTEVTDHDMAPRFSMRYIHHISLNVMGNLILSCANHFSYQFTTNTPIRDPQ